MAARKPKVIVTRKLPDSVETRMRELFDTELNVTDEPMTRKQLIEAISRCDVLAPTITDKIDAGLIAKAGEKLKLIANFGAGVDHIDIAAANAAGLVVTTARGGIIDEQALADLLADNKIAGAGLDVFELEPRINPKLLKSPNAVLLPHMASATVEGRVDMGEKVIINIKTWMDGHRPP